MSENGAYIENTLRNFVIVIMTTAAASNITIDDITLSMEAFFNRFTKSSVTVFSVVNVDVRVLVAVVVTVFVRFSCLICVKVVATGIV